jgi:hypothetical protein
MKSTPAHRSNAQDSSRSGRDTEYEGTGNRAAHTCWAALWYTVPLATDTPTASRTFSVGRSDGFASTAAEYSSGFALMDGC